MKTKSNSELQQRRNTSRSCNEDVLLNIGFRRVGASSLFRNGAGTYILSPGISVGKHHRYWFDIRDANLQKMGERTKAWVLLRIVPSWFALFTIDRIRKHMNKKTQEIRSHSGLVYGFFCELDKPQLRITITSKSDQSSSFSNDLLDCTKVKQALADEV